MLIQIYKKYKMADKKLCVRFSPEVTKPAEMDQDLVRLVRWLKKNL